MKNIKIYTTSTCPWCIRVKNFLKENKIDFQNFDVSVDQLAANEMVKKSGQMGVPVIDIDGQIIVGFDQEKIKQALDLA